MLADVPGDAVEQLCAQNVSAGAQVDDGTLIPNWDGTRLNLDHAIWAMHPLAMRRN